MSSSQPEILYFETIAHTGEADQVLQVDEIKFDQAVYIDEIRVLPTGYNVNTLEKSPIHTGATRPMPCELEFFGKNLNIRSNRDRVRYRRLGKNTFHDETDMVYSPGLSIPTDSLIIKGKYESLTLVIVGVLASPKSPTPRHETRTGNKQIADVLLSNSHATHRLHPMDTLQSPLPTPSNVTGPTFTMANRSSPIIENPPIANNNHTDGVWVAPPEQSNKTNSSTTNFARLQNPRPTPSMFPPVSRINDDHTHEYNSGPVQSTHQMNRSQSGSMIHPCHVPHSNHPSSDFNHIEKFTDDMKDKQIRLQTVGPNSYRINNIDQITEDSNQVSHITGLPLMTPPFMGLSNQTSFTYENQRRTMETNQFSTNNAQEATSDADSFLSDDNTSESEVSSDHDVLFNEDEQQTFQRDALYNMRGSTRFSTLKMFHSSVKTVYQIEVEKLNENVTKRDNEDLISQLRKVLSQQSIDHCRVEFLELLESVCFQLPVALAGLNVQDELASAIERLTDWSLKLCDVDYIMSKQFIRFEETLFKVRIIKCGIRIASELSCLTEQISEKFIKTNVQSKLLDFYENNVISPSIKMSILKCLDKSIFFESGLLWFTGQHNEFPHLTCSSPYFRLVEKVQLGRETKRLMASINCLLRKLHLYEEFFSFRMIMKSLSLEESIKFSLEKAEENKRIFDESVISLETIRDLIMNSSDLLSQEKSYQIAPFQSIIPFVYSKVDNKENSWPFILRLMSDSDFFKSLTVLIHLCIVNQRQDLFNSIENILRQFLGSFDGLVFLVNQTSTSTALLKALYFAETKFEETNNDPIRPQLMCAFQTLNLIDELKSFCIDEKLQIDQNDLLQVLHRLLSLILLHHYVRTLSYKRQIIVRVLAMESNFDCLLKLIESTNVNEMKTSIRLRYISRIIYEVFATSESVLFFQNYGLRLLNVCEQYSNRRLARVRQWLLPLSKFKSFEHSEEIADQFINELKTLLEESTRSGELAPGLMTIMRLIQHFCILPENQYSVGAQIELKYDFILLKLYSLGIYPLLISLLEKCSDILLRFWQIGIPLNIPDRIVIYGILIPTLILLRTLLQKLMSDRKSKFIDMKPIRVLHSLYTGTLCESPSTEFKDVDVIRTNLIDAVLAYSWSISAENEPINISTCSWTAVLQEILRLIGHSPYSMMSSLCFITELLPIPLPHTVRQELSVHECNLIRDDFHRYHAVLYYIWTHDSNNQIQKLIQTQSYTSNTIMQEVFRRFCMQLIDLGPKLAKLVMKTIVDELILTWKNNQTEIQKNSKFFISQSGRLVSIIASLTAIRSGKCALLSLINSQEEKYLSIMKDLLEYLHTRVESSEICICQEATMSIFQALCDANLSLSSSKSSENSLQILANALPKEELLSNILTNIVKLLSASKQHITWAQTTMALRTLVSLAEHDFGLQLIQKALTENNQVFCSLIADFDLRFDKEQPDYLEAVSTLMLFFQRIITIEHSQDSTFIRARHFPVKTFRELLGVSEKNGNQFEKFIDLINAIVDDDTSATHETETKEHTNGSSNVLVQTDDEQQCLQTLQKILKLANNTLQVLKNEDNKSDTQPNTTITLPKPESIETQFQNRLIYVVLNDYNDDQRNSELYWLGIPAPALLDDVDFGQDDPNGNPEETSDKVKCDLEETINKYCGTFKFFDEYKKQVIDQIKRKKKSSSKKRPIGVEPTNNVDTSIIRTTVSKNALPWSAPMRGSTRRNTRAGNITLHTHNPSNGTQRRIDHFRTRPLNTSRPPSMHVDDFEKQFHEHGNNSNTGNSSTNNNNVNDGNNEGSKGNDIDLMNSIQTSNDNNNSEREHWQRRGTSHLRMGSLSHHRYSYMPTHLGYPGGHYGFRDRVPYPYPASRYNMFDMEFSPLYLSNDEMLDDRPYDSYTTSMSFDSYRYRGHFGRYDSAGFH